MSKTIAIQVRLSPEEHRRWFLASGGKRKLSLWIREHMNKVCDPGPYQCRPVAAKELKRWKSMIVPAGAPQVPLTGRELDHLLANSDYTKTPIYSLTTLQHPVYSNHE